VHSVPVIDSATVTPAFNAGKDKTVRSPPRKTGAVIHIDEHTTHERTDDGFFWLYGSDESEKVRFSAAISNWTPSTVACSSVCCRLLSISKLAIRRPDGLGERRNATWKASGVHRESPSHREGSDSRSNVASMGSACAR
jgi:hypothetical protein